MCDYCRLVANALNVSTYKQVVSTHVHRNVFSESHFRSKCFSTRLMILTNSDKEQLKVDTHYQCNM